MGEINTGEENKDQAENGDAADQEETQTGAGAEGEDEGADTTEDENAEAEADGDEADKGEEGKTNKSKSKPTPADEPQTRKRNIDFILERKNAKIEKLQKGKANDAGADQEEDDLTDEDAQVIDRRVGKILSPFIEKQMQDEDKQEIADFVAKNPDFKPYADRVAKYAQHPTRKSMPIKAIFYEVAGDDLLKIGADRAKKAVKDTKHTQAGGGDNRGGDAPKDVWALTPTEFAAEQEKIRRKRE